MRSSVFFSNLSSDSRYLESVTLKEPRATIFLVRDYSLVFSDAIHASVSTAHRFQEHGNIQAKYSEQRMAKNNFLFGQFYPNNFTESE